MRRWILGVLAALSPLAAQGDVASGRPQFDWTNPAAWSDGATLTVAQITGFQLECTGAQVVSTRLAATGVPPAIHPAPPATALPPGAYACRIGVFARKTPTTAEVMGALSGPVNFTVPQPTPGVVTGLSVN
jgi:hypothetical protein